MRVTDGMRDATLISNTTKSSSAVYAASAQASTGLRVTTAADDPAAFARIVSADEHQRRLTTRIDNLDRVTADANAAENALAQSSDLLRQVKEIAVAMADGAVTAEDRARGSDAVAELRKSLAGMANTKGATGHLFGGSRTQAPPFDVNGNFSGDDVSLQVETDDGVRLRSNASGANAFTAAGGRDIFADLTELEARLSSNDADGVAAMLAPLDAGYDQVVHERSRVGLTIERMRTSSAAAADAKVVVGELRSNDAEVDATQAYTRLAQAQSAYERSLEISRRLLSTLSVEKMLP